MNLKNIKQKRAVRPLIERAILISRVQNTSQDDLVACLHLFETQLLKFKTVNQPDDVVALENITKRLTVLSTQLGQ